MIRRVIVGVLFAASALADRPYAQAPAPPKLRAAQPEDALRLERIWNAAYSPDGQLLAYLVTRPEASGISVSRDALNSRQRTEVWSAPVSGGAATRIAASERDGIGFESVRWSPDSQRLLVDAHLANGELGLWVWERRTNALRPLIKRGIRAVAGGAPWLDSHRVLVPLAPEGHFAVSGNTTALIAAAEANWAKGLAGREPAVSVLESGVPQHQPQGALAVLDVTTGQQRKLLDGNCLATVASPDRKFIACTRELEMTQASVSGMLRNGPTFLQGLSVVSLEGSPLSGTDQIIDVIPYTVQWSPDGSRLAVLAKAHVTDANPQLFEYSVAGKILRPLNVRGIQPVGDYSGQPPKLFWTNTNDVLLYARPESAVPSRADWWLVSVATPPRGVTSGMKAAPSTLLAERPGESFLGIVQGKLWRIRSDRVPEEISTTIGVPLTSFFWPRPRQWDWPSSSALASVLISAQRTSVADTRGETRDATPGEPVDAAFYALDLGSGRVTAVAAPVGAAFQHFAPQTATAAFLQSDRNGSVLSVTRGSTSDSRVIHRVNTFLREFAEPQWKRIDYRSTDDRPLIGWVALPTGYQDGRRYPLVTVVYAGTVQGTAPPPFQRIGETIGSSEAPMLTGHGYVALFPSMPRLPFGAAADNYSELTKGVLPAIDRVIDAGIADPGRLGVMGASYGGFSVYGLITQTNRFKAAIAEAGAADFISNYGQFSGRNRYDEFPQGEQVSQQSLAETGQLAMGAPPWKDVQRYVRNSPILYADRVETPILIIQGDFDFVPIHQGEEFFSAMYRQGKRARFLRYWTSGHGIGGVNGVDAWKQRFAWFDEFLKKPADPKGRAGR